MEIFTRKWSEISGGRLDPLYYINLDLNIQTVPLKQIVSIKSGKRIPKGKTYSTTPTSYKYLRVDDLDSNKLEIDIDSLKSIDETLFALLKRYEICNDDIALSIAGTIGKIFLFKNQTHNRVILTENCVRLKTHDGVLPKFLSILLKTNFLQNQMSREYIQTTIPKLAIERIKELKIPYIPPLPTQQKIIDIMDNAYKQKAQKEQQAKELLDSIDSYLMQELGIALPQKDYASLEKRIFTQKLSQLSGSRFDPNYHQSYYQDLEKALAQSAYPLLNISQIISSFKKGIEVGSEAYSNEKEIPFIRVSDIDNEGISYDKVEKFIKASLFENLKSFKPKDDELLYSKDGTIGLCLKADTSRDYIISSAILRLELKKEVNIDFIQNILSSHLLNILANRKAIGAVIKHLNINEFLSLKIPLPPLSIQEKLAIKMQNDKAKAKLLKKEAKELLNLAKIDIENLILSNGGGVTYEFNIDFKSLEKVLSMDIFANFEKNLQSVWEGGRYRLVRLGTMIHNIQTGTTPHKSLNPYFQNANIKFIRNSDLQNGEIILDNIKAVDENLKDMLVYSQDNEVLVCIAGTIGVSAVNKIGKVAINQNISSLKFNEEIIPYFASYWLNSKTSLDLFTRNASIATIFYINNVVLLNFQIPLPPLEIQEQIANEIIIRKQRAQKLQQEAKELLESAKKNIEHIILGE